MEQDAQSIRPGVSRSRANGGVETRNGTPDEKCFERCVEEIAKHARDEMCLFVGGSRRGEDKRDS